MVGFVKRFQREVIADLESFKHEEVQKHLPIFLSDSFHDALIHCADAHYAIIVEALHADDALLSELNRDDILTSTAFADGLTSRASFDSGHWTAADTVQFGLSYAGFDTTLARLLTGLVGLKLSGRENLTHYRQQLNQSLPELQDAVTALITEKYQDIAFRVAEVIDAAYRQQIASVLAALRQALGLRSAGALSAAEANRTLDLILSNLERTRNEVQEFHLQVQTYGEERIVEMLEE
jgi:hypothetical protein